MQEKRQKTMEGMCGNDMGALYGLLNLDSIINVLPFIKDNNNHFVFNKELQHYTV